MMLNLTVMSDRKDPPRRIDLPEPGCFAVKLVRGGPRVPARIVCENGLWSADIDGKPCGAAHEDPLYADGVFRVWQGGKIIDETEYRHMLAIKSWAAEHRPTHPSQNPRKPIGSLAKIPPIFQKR